MPSDSMRTSLSFMNIRPFFLRIPLLRYFFADGVVGLAYFFSSSLYCMKNSLYPFNTLTSSNSLNPPKLASVAFSFCFCGLAFGLMFGLMLGLWFRELGLSALTKLVDVLGRLVWIEGGYTLLSLLYGGSYGGLVSLSVAQSMSRKKAWLFSSSMSVAPMRSAGSFFRRRPIKSYAAGSMLGLMCVISEYSLMFLNVSRGEFPLNGVLPLSNW